MRQAVEIGDELALRRPQDLVAVARGHSVDGPWPRRGILKLGEQGAERLLAFAAHDAVDRRRVVLAAEIPRVEEREVGAADHGANARVDRLDQPHQLHDLVRIDGVVLAGRDDVGSHCAQACLQRLPSHLHGQAVEDLDLVAGGACRPRRAPAAPAAP